MTHTIKLTFTDTELLVEKRDGASITVDVAQIPDDMFADFALDGIAEYIRDSSSAALMNAYLAAHDGESGDVASRAEWAKGNTQSIAVESAAMMTAARDRLYEGNRTARRAAAPVDPLDDFRIAVLRDVMRDNPKGPVAKAYKAIDSTDQRARREFLLATAAKNADVIEPLAKARRKEAEKRAATLAESIGNIAV